MQSFFQRKPSALIYLFKKSLEGHPFHIAAQIPKHFMEIIGTDYLSFHPELVRDSKETSGTIVARSGQTLEADREWFQGEAANNGIIQWGTYEIDEGKMKNFLKTRGMYLSDNGLYLLLAKNPSVNEHPNKLLLDLLQKSIKKPTHDPLELLKDSLKGKNEKRVRIK